MSSFGDGFALAQWEYDIEEPAELGGSCGELDEETALLPWMQDAAQKAERVSKR